MFRYTKKLNSTKDTDYKYIIKNKDTDISKIITRLGELEDIQDKLGIDLVELLNGYINSNTLESGYFKQEIYTIYKDKIIICEVMCLVDGDFITVSCDGEDVGSSYDLETLYLKLKNYKKKCHGGWAFNKKDLE